MPKLTLLPELGEFLWQRKKWWLFPVVVVLMLLGGLIVVTQGATALPFLYALF